jgi:hypothetical protein
MKRPEKSKVFESLKDVSATWDAAAKAFPTFDIHVGFEFDVTLRDDDSACHKFTTLVEMTLELLKKAGVKIRLPKSVSSTPIIGDFRGELVYGDLPDNLRNRWAVYVVRHSPQVIVESDVEIPPIKDVGVNKEDMVFLFHRKRLGVFLKEYHNIFTLSARFLDRLIATNSPGARVANRVFLVLDRNPFWSDQMIAKAAKCPRTYLYQIHGFSERKKFLQEQQRVKLFWSSKISGSRKKYAPCTSQKRPLTKSGLDFIPYREPVDTSQTPSWRSRRLPNRKSPKSLGLG